MADLRRVGQAQRRRMGGSPNVYGTAVKPPAYGIGDTVKARGRYGTGVVVGITPGVVRPSASDGVDGHGYHVSAGNGARVTLHLSSELKSAPTPAQFVSPGLLHGGDVVL